MKHEHANVISNLAFIGVGILALIDNPGAMSVAEALSTGLFATSCILMGLASAWFHREPRNRKARLCDRWGMYLLLACLIGLAGGFDWWISLIIAGVTIIPDWRGVGPDSFTVIGILGGVLMVWLFINHPWRNALVCLMSFVSALMIRFVVITDDRSHGWAHAAWHLSAAVAIFFTYTTTAQ